MAAKKDPTAARPSGDSYSVYDPAGKKLAGGVSRAEAVARYNEAKAESGSAPKLVRDSDGRES